MAKHKTDHSIERYLNFLIKDKLDKSAINAFMSLFAISMLSTNIYITAIVISAAPAMSTLFLVLAANVVACLLFSKIGSMLYRACKKSGFIDRSLIVTDISSFKDTDTSNLKEIKVTEIVYDETSADLIEMSDLDLYRRDETSDTREIELWDRILLTIYF